MPCLHLINKHSKEEIGTKPLAHFSPLKNKHLKYMCKINAIMIISGFCSIWIHTIQVPVATKCNLIYSLTPSEAYMQYNIPTLLQIMARRLFGTKPLSELMLPHCQLDKLTARWHLPPLVISGSKCSSLDNTAMVDFPLSIKSVCLNFFVHYNKVPISPSKFKVKIMAKAKPDGHIWGLKYNWYLWFSFLWQSNNFPPR